MDVMKCGVKVFTITTMNPSKFVFINIGLCSSSSSSSSSSNVAYIYSCSIIWHTYGRKYSKRKTRLTVLLFSFFLLYTLFFIVVLLQLGLPVNQLSTFRIQPTHLIYTITMMQS